jgi:sugar lactone lactonase YvrE
VLRYHGGTGAFLGVFASGGGLSVPQHLAFGPHGDLYVESVLTPSILRYDGRTGAPKPAPGQPGAVFIPNLRGGPLGFGPDGALYVVTTEHDVRRYDARTGAFKGIVVAPGSGGLLHGSDLVFDVDGRLYVSTHRSASVPRFDARTGALVDLFVPPGSGGLAAPIALTFMPLSNTSSSGVEPVDWER